MSDRITKLATSAPVQNYATGAAQDATRLMAVANFLAPTVTVPANFNYQSYSLQNGFIIPDTYRGIGGRANQVKTGGTNNTGNLDPYALDYPLDQFEQNLPDGELINAMNNRSLITAQLSALSWSKQVVDAALTSVGGGTAHAGTTSGMDFINKIDEAIISVIKATGAGELCPVKVLWGPGAFRTVKNHSSTKDRFKGAKKDTANPSLDDIMGLLIGNPANKITWNTYDSAKEGQTASRSFILDTSVLIFCSADTPSTLDPSFMKTFRSSRWMTTGTYEREDGRGDVFKVDWEAKPVVTNSGACIRLVLTDS